MPLLEYELTETFFSKIDLLPFQYFCVHAGAGFPLKVWSKENFEKSIEIVLDQYPHLDAVIIEGPDDPILFEKKNLPSRVTVYKGPLEDVAKVLSGSLFLIDNDSGVHHLAGILDIPTISIFGPTGPGTWKSLTEKNFILWGWNNCNKPCNYHTLNNCRDQVCLSSIKPLDVLNLVPKILEMYNQ